jgi:FMN phosphatase YigB (HAD superfamily)
MSEMLLAKDVKEIHWDVDGVLLLKKIEDECEYYVRHTIYGHDNLKQAFKRLYNKDTPEGRKLNEEYQKIRDIQDEMKFYDYKHKLLLQLLGISVEEKLLAELKDVMLGYFYYQRTLAPGAQEVLEYLKSKDVIQRIVSNAFPGRPDLDILSGRFGNLGEYFSSYIISAIVGSRKPDDKIYKIALEKLAVSPEEVLFIDDRRENVEAAIRNGYGIAVHLDNKLADDTQIQYEEYEGGRIYTIAKLVQILSILDFN